MSKDAFGKRSGGVIPPRKWSKADTLEAVRQMNEHFLQTLRSFAGPRADKYPLQVILRHRRLWQLFDERALKCAAQSPVLLIDVHFHEWRTGGNGLSHTLSGIGEASGAPSTFPPRPRKNLCGRR